MTIAGLEMKGLFKSKPRTPVEVVRHTRELLIFVGSSQDVRESKREEKVYLTSPLYLHQKDVARETDFAY